MTDLHSLLHDPWCPRCGQATGWHDPGKPYTRIECKCGGVKMPLATRMPEAVPAGLGWSEKIRVWLWYTSIINDDAAELLFVGNAVDQYHAVTFALHGEKWSCIVLGHYGSGDSKVAALTAALHHLCDERDEAKEKT